ncbi:MAG: hypothetical protein EOO05_04710 [Chitinophagaceae bacterium]|nr:MAG: hypothetical protein EOO05_04710 [Chitinophagaceae bacterium]
MKRATAILICFCLPALRSAGQGMPGSQQDNFPGGYISDYRGGPPMYSIISLAIILLLLGYLLLVRRLVTDPRIFRFASLAALLLVFGLLHTLLYPAMLTVTGNSQVFMGVGLLLLISVLVPIHYKMEKWATAKLERKNKRIRLASARKTIEKS